MPKFISREFYGLRNKYILTPLPLRTRNTILLHTSHFSICWEGFLLDIELLGNRAKGIWECNLDFVTLAKDIVISR